MEEKRKQPHTHGHADADLTLCTLIHVCCRFGSEFFLSTSCLRFPSCTERRCPPSVGPCLQEQLSAVRRCSSPLLLAAATPLLQLLAVQRCRCRCARFSSPSSLTAASSVTLRNQGSCLAESTVHWCCSPSVEVGRRRRLFPRAGRSERSPTPVADRPKVGSSGATAPARRRRLPRHPLPPRLPLPCLPLCLTLPRP